MQKGKERERKKDLKETIKREEWWMEKEDGFMPLAPECPTVSLRFKMPGHFLATFQTLGSTLEFQARSSFLCRSGHCNVTRNYSILPLTRYKAQFSE